MAMHNQQQQSRVSSLQRALVAVVQACLLSLLLLSWHGSSLVAVAMGEGPVGVALLSSVRSRPPLPNPPGLAIGLNQQRGQSGAAQPAEACVSAFEAPIIDSVQPADRELAVSLLPPPNLTRSCLPVAAYIVTDSTGQYSARVDVSAMTLAPTGDTDIVVRLSGLRNGVPLALTAVAVNGAVRSPESIEVVATPATTPGPPSITATREGAQSIVLTFSPPADDGGSPITAYSVVDLRGAELDVTTTFSPFLITGLQDGQTYQLVLIASNSIGASSPSAPTPLLTPQPLPLKPHVVAVRSGLSKSLRVYWFDTAPGPIGVADSFRVMIRSGSIVGGALSVRVTSVTAHRSPADLTALTDGGVYNISVVGVNEVGEGAPSRVISVTVGTNASSFSFFPAASYQHQCVANYAAAPTTSSSTFPPGLAPIPWSVLEHVNLTTLVPCTYPQPPSADSSTAPSSPPPTPSVSGSTGTGDSTGDSNDALGSSGVGVPVAPPADSVPPAGAVRLEILLEFDGSVDVPLSGASFWTALVARWAQMLGMPHERIVIVAMDPNAEVATKRRSLGALLALVRKGADWSLEPSSQPGQGHMHTLAARAAVMLVVDILPPLSETDVLSSTRMAANLTDALEDPQSPVGLQLTSSGATVAKVSAFANLGAVPPPGEDDSALDTSSQSFRLGLGIGGAVVVLLCCVLVVVLVRYWKHRRDTAKAAPPGTDAAAPAAAAAAVATGADQCDARRGAPMRGKPARPDPAARANGMDRPFDGGVVHLHEHSEPVTVERRESYLRDAMRIDPEYVADPEYSLYRQEVARRAQAAVRSSPPRHHWRRPPEFTDQMPHYVFHHHQGRHNSHPLLDHDLPPLPAPLVAPLVAPAVAPSAPAAAASEDDADASVVIRQHNFYEVDASALDPAIFFPAMLSLETAATSQPPVTAVAAADQNSTDDSSQSSEHSPAPLIGGITHEPLQLPLQPSQQHISPVSPLPPAAIVAHDSAASTEGASLFARSAPLLPPFSFAAASVTPAV